jgi:hypothetical protein
MTSCFDHSIKDRAWFLSDERLWCTLEGKAVAKMIKQKYAREAADENDSTKTLSVLKTIDRFLDRACDYDYPEPILNDATTQTQVDTKTASLKTVKSSNDTVMARQASVEKEKWNDDSKLSSSSSSSFQTNTVAKKTIPKQ